MSDRMVSEDYQLRGQEIELWTDGHANPGMSPNWWLVVRKDSASFPKLPRHTVLTGEENGFDPPLTAREIENIGEAVLGHLTF